MPTRIMYWNINNFSLPKVYVPAPPAAANEAAQRLNFIVNGVVNGGPALPDIFIIVEVYSRVREVGLEGGVLDSGRNAGRACLGLLNVFRNVFGPTWCLVPPLNLGEGGQREAVAVYYNAANLQLVGPNLFYDRWPGNNLGQGQPVAPATFANIIDYPLVWKNCLPNPGNPWVPLQMNRTSNFPGGIVVPEFQIAGQWEYYTGVRPIPSPIQPPYPVNRVQFPNAGCRAPFWVRFEEVVGNRLLDVFSVHTSPASARQAILQMQNTGEMSNAVAANNVNVVIGDFNVDAYAANAWVYNWMINGQYTMELDPRVAHAGALVPARKPYLMTHLLPTAQAWPFNTAGGYGPDPQHNVYPRYGYMGSAWPAINDSGAIDNVFTAYGGAAGGPATNITIANRVIGTPYNGVNPAPVGVTAELTGGLAYPAGLTNNIPQPTNAPAPVTPGGVNPPVDNINFQAWQNFGGVHSTSDHLPVVIDI